MTSMPMTGARRRAPGGALPAALTVVAALACSDATGPSAESAHPLLVLRATHLPEAWEYTGRTGRCVAIDSAGPIYDVAASADGRLAVSTAVENGTVGAILETTRDGRWLRTIERARRELSTSAAHGLAYSPDGQRLAWWVSYARIDSLFVLDPGSAAPRAIARRPTPFGQAIVRWTPSGKIALKDDTALVAVDPASGAMTTVFTNPDTILDFDFAADGRLVVTTLTLPGRSSAPPSWRMLAQRVVGGPMLPVVTTPESPRELVRWSPDGQRIATTSVESVVADGVEERRTVPDVVDLSGARHRIRTGAAALSSIAGWTPDGRVVFLAYPPRGPGEPSGRPDVYVALPGGRTTNLTDTPDTYETVVVIPP